MATSKMKKTRQFIHALATFLGTIIGVGIFALPYNYIKAPGLSIVILILSAAILGSIYIAYLDLIFEKGIGFHQLPGIVKKLFGQRWQNLVTILLSLSRSGILFLYMLIGGDFGHLVIKNLFGIEVSRIVISMAIFFLASLAIRRKIKFLARIQFWLSLFIILTIAVVSGIGLARIGLSDLSFIGELSSGDLGISEKLGIIGVIYGTSIGALSGIAAVPSMKGLIENENKLRLVTSLAGLIATLVYTGFALFVITNSSSVTPDALSGLGSNWWVSLMAAVGLVCVVTSYLSLGNSLFEIFNIDYKASENIAWLMTFIPPTLLLLSGFDNFAEFAALIGGAIGGIESIIILVCYWVEEKRIGELTGKLKFFIVVAGIVLGFGVFLSI